MVAIAPFRAVRYDPAKVRLSAVTSPPHDVITETERASFAKEAANIVHAILPVPRGAPEGYAAATKALAGWLADGTMVRDARPVLYLYEVTHDVGGEPVTMRGVFCRLRLDHEYDTVRRHERTLKSKKSDRLELRRATRYDPEPIWLLYRDERGWVDEVLTSNAFEELARFRDEHGVEHALWRIDRPEAVGEVIAQFEDRTVVIADGHHRYQTALDHHAETGRDEDGSLLVCLVRDTDPGLRIEPTHRLVSGLGVDRADAAAQAVARDWADEALELPGDGDAAGRVVRSLVDEDPRCCVVVAKEDARILRLQEGADVDEGRGRLDSLVVTRVHERLLAPLGLDEDRIEDHVRYARDAGEAIRAVRGGECDLAVMMAGDDVDAVLDVATQGHVMPQKSTYFVPKLRSGLVLSPLDEPLPRDWREIAGDGGPADFRLPPLS